MKSTGIVRKVDELGRIVLPMELRRTKGINADNPLEIYVDGDSIVLRKYQPGCIICGDVDNLVHVDGSTLCIECARKVTVALGGVRA